MSEAIFKTAWGWMGIAATARGVRAIVLPKPNRRAVERAFSSLSGARTVPPAKNGGNGNGLKAARTAITAYLAGETRVLDLPLDLTHRTSFQVKVWQALRAIPYGRVRSYGWVARRIGRPNAARAVGAACGANPVPLLVPCHRVVAGDGSLGGFSGGLSNKRRLLKLEGARIR